MFNKGVLFLRINTPFIVHKMHIHSILGTDSIMFCDSLRYFTMGFDGFSFKDVAGCFNKKRDRAVYYWD